MNELNIKNLEVGKEYKLPILLELLGKKYTNDTRGRKRALEDIKQFLIIEDLPKKFYKFIGIREIFNKKIDNRGKNENSHKHSTSSYEELEYILLDYISKSKDTIYISNNILASQVLTNNNYYFSMKNQKYFNIYLKKNEKLSNNTITKDLFENINTSCKGIIQTALKSLSKKYKLNYDYNYILIEYIQINYKIIEQTRQATEEEIKIIDTITKNYISKFNEEHETKIKNLNDICYLTEKLYRKFYDELNTEIFEALYKEFNVEIKMYFKGYIIRTLANADEILKDIDIDKLKEKLNKKFIKNSINNIKRQIDRKKKIIEEYTNDKIEKNEIWGRVDNDAIEKIAKNNFNYRDVLMIKDKYKNEYIDILNFILDINTKDITLEIKNIIVEIRNKKTGSSKEPKSQKTSNIKHSQMAQLCG